MNYTQILKKGENFLKKNNIQNPYLDVELILSKVVNRKREEILLNANNKLKNVEITKFQFLYRKLFFYQIRLSRQILALLLLD